MTAEQGRKMGQKFIAHDDGRVEKQTTERSLANSKPKREKKAAIDQAMDYLSYRDRTESEMAAYLEKKQYTEREIAQAMAQLKHYGYVDDARYVKQMCERNRLGRHDGRKKLRWDLKRRGVRDDVLKALDDYVTDDIEQENCEALLALAKKRYARERGAKKRQKILQWMARRGYNFAMVAPMLSDMRAEESDEPVDEDALRDDLERAYVKYYNMQARKGYDGWELKARVNRNLHSRGFSSAMIRERIAQGEEDGDFA